MAAQNQASPPLEIDLTPPAAKPMQLRVHNQGSRVAQVGKATTTPKADKSVKTVQCPTYKTLCSALFQIAKREDAIGTWEFCNAIVNPLGGVNDRPYNDHTVVVGGGDPFVHVEDTEFRNEGTNDFYDTEYIEAGYALERLGYPPFGIWIAYVLIKRTVESGVPEYVWDSLLYLKGATHLPIALMNQIASGTPDPALAEDLEAVLTKSSGKNLAKVMPKLKALVARKSFDNPPNTNGLMLGVGIARSWGSIGAFARQYCADKRLDPCEGDPQVLDPAREQLKKLPKLEPPPPFVPPPAKAPPPKK